MDVHTADQLASSTFIAHNMHYDKQHTQPACVRAIQQL